VDKFCITLWNQPFTDLLACGYLVDKLDEKNKRRKSRARNLAHKDSPYSKKGHGHRTARDYRRTEKYPVHYDEAL
jgi:hypothetical protein